MKTVCAGGSGNMSAADLETATGLLTTAQFCAKFKISHDTACRLAREGKLDPPPQYLSRGWRFHPNTRRVRWPEVPRWYSQLERSRTSFGPRGLALPTGAAGRYVIVTRHAALAEVLKSGLPQLKEAPVIEHATQDDVRGKWVYGVLPLRLAVHAEAITEIELDLPPELRGQELTAEQIRAYIGQPQTYRVEKI